MVILLYSDSSTLPYNYHLSQIFFFFFLVEAIFPRLIQQINSAFWLLTNRKKEKENTFNIWTHVLHHWTVVFTVFWIGCACLCFAEQAAAQSSHHSINCVSTLNTYVETESGINGALRGSSWRELTNVSSHLFMMCISVIHSPKVRWRFSQRENPQKELERLFQLT